LEKLKILSSVSVSLNVYYIYSIWYQLLNVFFFYLQYSKQFFFLIVSQKLYFDLIRKFS
jgi:hypothetical protein